LLLSKKMRLWAHFFMFAFIWIYSICSYVGKIIASKVSKRILWINMIKRTINP